VHRLGPTRARGRAADAGRRPEAEVDADLAAHAGARDRQGRRLVVRNGHARQRQVLTAAGDQGARVQGRGLAMASTLRESARDRWWAVNGPHLVALVRAGARFDKGILVERPDVDEAAGVAA
jgi:hypothetical protein